MSRDSIEHVERFYTREGYITIDPDNRFRDFGSPRFEECDTPECYTLLERASEVSRVEHTNSETGETRVEILCSKCRRAREEAKASARRRKRGQKRRRRFDNSHKV